MNRKEPSTEVRCPECLGELPGGAGTTATALLENGCVYCGADLTRASLQPPR